MRKFLIVFIVVVCLAAGGYFLWQRFFKKPEEKPNNHTISQTQSQDPFEQGFDKLPATEDPFNDPNGPFYHNVKLAISDDGVRFVDTGRIILEKASVPDAVALKDGTILIYAVDGAQRSNSQLLVARSKDGGKTWQSASVKLSSKRKNPGGVDPDVVLMPDGKIRLFYIVNPEKLPPKEEGKMKTPPTFKMINKIYSAISDDGVNFKEDLGPLYKGEEITDPDIIKIDNLWFAYISRAGKDSTLMLATAKDNLKFKFVKLIRENGSISDTVKVSEDLYRQFYPGKGGILSAETEDGYTFKNETLSLKQGKEGVIIADPTVVKVGDKWLMFYKEQQAFNKPD